jgi:hypothetical protein
MSGYLLNNYLSNLQMKPIQDKADCLGTYKDIQYSCDDRNSDFTNDSFNKGCKFQHREYGQVDQQDGYNGNNPAVALNQQDRGQDGTGTGKVWESHGKHCNGAAFQFTEFALRVSEDDSAGRHNEDQDAASNFKCRGAYRKNAAQHDIPEEGKYQNNPTTCQHREEVGAGPGFFVHAAGQISKNRKISYGIHHGKQHQKVMQEN